MNINSEIQDYVKTKPNLDMISTGGGCDYVWRKLNDKVEVILADPDDCSSPDSLYHKANMCIYTDGEPDECGQWCEGVNMIFPTLQMAMDFLNDMEDVAGTITPKKPVKSYLENTVQNAMGAFWREVSDRYPDIKSGDLDPMADYAFQQIAETTTREWVKTNTDDSFSHFCSFCRVETAHNHMEDETVRCGKCNAIMHR